MNFVFIPNCIHQDLPATVRKVSTFMGKTFTDNIIDQIVSASTFKAMKENPSSNPDSVFHQNQESEFGTFMRKGTVYGFKVQRSVFELGRTEK